MMQHTFRIGLFVCGSAVSLLMSGCPQNKAVPEDSASNQQKTTNASRAGHGSAHDGSAAQGSPVKGTSTHGPIEPLPTGWKWVAGDDLPSVARSKPDLPATVNSDDNGVEVTITDTSRTVAGGDDIIMVMEALGLSDQVHAAPTSSVTEAGKKAPNHFLFNRNTGIEGILSLNGSLFIGNSIRRHGKLVEPLRGAGQTIVIVDELQSAPDKVRKISTIFGHQDEGEQLATKIQDQLEQAVAVAEKSPRKPRVIMLSATGGGGAPTVAGFDTAAAMMIRMAGGINIGDESKVPNYSQLSHEGILSANPEVIIVTENDLKEFGGESGLWKAYPSLKLTAAGEANRVWVMPDLQLKITSVACGTGALALANALSEQAQNPAP